MLKQLIMLLMFAILTPGPKEPTKVIDYVDLKIEKTEEVVLEEVQLIRVTCYLPTGNKTASGVYPQEGMCASNWSNMGKIAVLYDLDMNYIGEFEVTDVGSNSGLKNGTKIDVFRNNRSSMQNFISTYGDYCYVIWRE